MHSAQQETKGITFWRHQLQVKCSGRQKGRDVQDAILSSMKKFAFLVEREEVSCAVTHARQKAVALGMGRLACKPKQSKIF